MLRTILVAIIGLLLVGCSASTPKTPAEKYKGHPPDKLLQTGEKQLAKGYYEDAEEHFEAVKSLHPFSRQAKQAQIDLIYTYYWSSKYQEAIAAANRYLKLYPRGKHVDYAYYMKGLVNFERTVSAFQRYMFVDASELDTTPLAQAFTNFNKVVTMYPHSVYAYDARYRMVYIRQVMAKHQLQTARFYLNNNMYVAAVNRASGVLEHYQGSGQTRPALSIMEQAYQELGLPDLAADARKLDDQLKDTY
jgi:outer membrane protein assembly factor BamD